MSKMEIEKISGLVAAPFTPMNKDYSLNLDLIPVQSKFLQQNDINGVFICGTTGESLSLTVKERLDIAETWKKCIGDLKLIIHVGHNCQADAEMLAKHASEISADAIGAMPPVFFRPSTVSQLVDWCARVAEQAPELPFYYYHIPSMSGVNLGMREFLECAGDKIPNLAGVKFTYENLYDYGRCVSYKNNYYDMLFGRDEILLAGLATGANGAVGSLYNFAAPVFNNIIKAFQEKDIKTAQMLQEKVRDFLAVYLKCGGSVATGKAVMKMIGIDCGPTRAPISNLSDEAYEMYLKEIKNIGFDQYLSKFES